MRPEKAAHRVPASDPMAGPGDAGITGVVDRASIRHRLRQCRVRPGERQNRHQPRGAIPGRSDHRRAAPMICRHRQRPSRCRCESCGRSSRVRRARPRDADTSDWPRPRPTVQRADWGWRGINTGPGERAQDASGRANGIGRAVQSVLARTEHPRSIMPGRSHRTRWRASGAAMVSATTCRILSRRVSRADRGIYVIDPAVNRQPPPVPRAFGSAAAYPLFLTPRLPLRRRGRGTADRGEAAAARRGAGIKSGTQNY